MRRIVGEISTGKPPSGTPEEKAWRAKLEAEFAAFKRDHPHAVLEVPADTEGLPG